MKNNARDVRRNRWKYSTSIPQPPQVMAPKRRKRRSRIFGFIGIAIIFCGLFLFYLQVHFGSIHNGLAAMRQPVSDFLFPSYEKLPDHYDPFESPTALARSLFAKDRMDFTASELAQAEREPGAIEFLVRLKNNKPFPDWNHKLDLQSEHLHANKYPHFVQWDERWAFGDYAGGPFGETGCGPTCLSMAYTGLTGKTDYPPDIMGDFATKNGYAVEGVGTAWALMESGANQLGLKSEGVGLDLVLFQTSIDNGKILVLSLGPGDFTKSGHFVLLWDYEGEMFAVLDPFNLKLGSKLWSYEELARQTAAVWALSQL